MTDAREIIALELARISKIDMSEAHPYARASIHTAALHIERALIAAGFRIIGKDEVDQVTVEKCAKVIEERGEVADEFYRHDCYEHAAAIRATGRKA